jgi:hypothetical protein
MAKELRDRKIVIHVTASALAWLNWKAREAGKTRAAFVRELLTEGRKARFPVEAVKRPRKKKRSPAASADPATSAAAEDARAGDAG